MALMKAMRSIINYRFSQKAKGSEIQSIATYMLVCKTDGTDFSLFGALLNELGRSAAPDFVGRNILIDDTACCYNRAFADRYSRQNDNMSSNPYIVLDDNGRASKTLISNWYLPTLVPMIGRNDVSCKRL